MGEVGSGRIGPEGHESGGFGVDVAGECHELASEELPIPQKLDEGVGGATTFHKVEADRVLWLHEVCARGRLPISPIINFAGDHRVDDVLLVDLTSAREGWW